MQWQHVIEAPFSYDDEPGLPFDLPEEENSEEQPADIALRALGRIQSLPDEKPPREGHPQDEQNVRPSEQDERIRRIGRGGKKDLHWEG